MWIIKEYAKICDFAYKLAMNECRLMYKNKELNERYEYHYKKMIELLEMYINARKK